MVDPISQQAQIVQDGKNTTSQVVDLSPEIQTLLQQQTDLKIQYDQYAGYLKNPQITFLQRDEINKYLQELATHYQKNVSKLQQLGYITQRVTTSVALKPVSGSRLSLKTFLLGSLGIFVLLVGGSSAMFYYLLQNPTQLSTVGLDLETTTNLLSTFSIIFFALIVFSGMGILLLNGYKLISVKNTSKFKYILGGFFGLFIFVLGLGLGYQTLNKIKSISVTNSLDNAKLVLPYVYFKNGLIPLSSDPKIVLLAPSSLQFKLNVDLFNAQIKPAFGQSVVNSIILDCGNGQTLSMDMNNAQFNENCMYFSKGMYPMSIKVLYTNNAGEKMNKDIPAGTLNFVSQFSVAPIGGDLIYNDAKTELSVGKVPTKVRFDASRVFSDLGLANYSILWDINGDGTMDQSDVSSFTTSYKEAKLYNIAIRLPDLNDYVYTFPLRVEQSDVPVCEISARVLDATTHEFNVNFLTDGVIQEYQYEIFSDSTVIYTVKSKKPSFVYQLPANGVYSVKTTFITDQGKQGRCESDDIDVGAVAYKISYSAQYKGPSKPVFESFPTSGAVSMNQDVIVLSELPTIIKFSLDSIQPNEEGLIKQFLFDGKPVLSADNKFFEIKVDTPTPHFATFIVKNPSSGAITQKKIQIIINRSAILGKLIIKPDIVGTDPFTVTFDASTTTLNDPTDEIIYFTWDFGDGEIKKNISQSIMQHIYTYNSSIENGVYMPKITVVTKKGLTGSITSEYPITVKKKVSTLTISIDSHPSQVAKVGDRVHYSLQLNGLPKSIIRDFGNEKTLQCSNRECVQATAVYTTPGKYTVKAKVIYQNSPEIEGTIAIKVQ